MKTLHATRSRLVLILFLFSCGDDGGPTGDDGTPGSRDFVPSSNITLEGSRSFDRVDIPAGVTVTAIADLALEVAGEVSIGGSLVGDCVTITINGQAAVRITGTIRNDCVTQPGASPPELTIVGDGELVLSGTMSSSGDVVVKNDPNLTEADFPAEGLAPAGGLAAAQKGHDCAVSDFSFVPNPDVAPTGSGGQRGGKGGDASTWRLLCRGNGRIEGGVSVLGQDGGKGGEGKHESADHATATGGDGGKGGLIQVLVVGNLTFTGLNTVKSGEGGDGGMATATGLPGKVAPRAAGATARGGDGEDPGLIDVRSLGTLTASGALTLEVGTGGDGGDGVATGADGSADVFCEEGKVQSGGVAEATGGEGSDSPDRGLVKAGRVEGPSDPTLKGGQGGKGGMASASPGDGGPGVDCGTCKHGGDGGDGTVEGGRGGDSRTRDLQGDPIAPFGGGGGEARLTKGNGAPGFECCKPPVQGGNGGAGGAARGSDGEGGSGALADGADGGLSITAFGNGSGGGKGVPPGGAGGAGNDGTAAAGPKIGDGSFVPGVKGAPCPVPPPTKQQMVQASPYTATVTIENETGSCGFEGKWTGGSIVDTGSDLVDVRIPLFGRALSWVLGYDEATGAVTLPQGQAVTSQVTFDNGVTLAVTVNGGRVEVTRSSGSVATGGLVPAQDICRATSGKIEFRSDDVNFTNAILTLGLSEIREF